MSDSEDTIDRVCEDIFQKIRALEKQKAFFSVLTLVDSFLGITEEFSINPSEYMYYRDKYQSSSESDEDLSRSQIIEYLSTIIQRLESITEKKFVPESENLDNSDPPLPTPSESDIVLDQELASNPITLESKSQPEDEVINETVSAFIEEIEDKKNSEGEKETELSFPAQFIPPVGISPSSENDQEVKKEIPPQSVYQRIRSSRLGLSQDEQELQSQLEHFPDLQEIFEETMNLNLPNEQISLRKEVFSLKYFGYPEKAPEMDYIKKQKERNAKGI